MERKAEWIGNILQDFAGAEDVAFGAPTSIETEIVDITLEENGDSAFLRVVGKEFSCGFDTEVGGIIGGEKGYITFSGYGNHVWRIKNNI